MRRRQRLSFERERRSWMRWEVGRIFVSFGGSKSLLFWSRRETGFCGKDQDSFDFAGGCSLGELENAAFEERRMRLSKRREDSRIMRSV